MSQTYDTHATGLRILAGQWRPHYPWEHIAWISPPWPSQDYLWLDFPEAVFTDQGLIFLSHINPTIPAVHTELPRIPWRVGTDELSFERVLPNGVRLGGSIRKDGEACADLSLRIENGSKGPLRDIKLQTCLFLRACREFADYTLDNKYVHVPELGWKRFTEAQAIQSPRGRFHLGWRSGPPAADLPVMVALSNRESRLVAMSWYEDTLSLIGNPVHPCLHADPRFKDLEVGEQASIRGRIVFYAGILEEFALPPSP